MTPAANTGIRMRSRLTTVKKPTISMMAKDTACPLGRTRLIQSLAHSRTVLHSRRVIVDFFYVWTVTCYNKAARGLDFSQSQA
jgi:hypothetical protein